jgi:Protein of unknown function (DUF2914)
MLRMFAVFVVIVVFAASGFAAELVSMKLCSTRDYDSAAKDCAAGKGLEGNSIQIDPSKIGSLQFLTALKTSGEEEIYHVWIYGKSSKNVLVYDSTTKTLREADATELTWLKERNIEGARVIVKMTASASERFRLRSSKTLTQSMAGSWTVQVYDATQTKALGEMQFTVGQPEKGITERVSQ